MTNTIETPQTPSHDEYGIFATFSEQSLDQLVEIQDQLSECLGDAIWLTPRRALHSTLMEVICDKDYGVPRKQLFDTWHAEHGDAVAKTFAELPPFDITFTELEISQRAIIVRLRDSEAFNDIRSRLLSRIVLPDGTKLPPDITHCSLARYTSSVNLEEIVDKTHAIRVDFTEHISSFKLLKDLGPPAFRPQTIQEYGLQA